MTTLDRRTLPTATAVVGTGSLLPALRANAQIAETPVPRRLPPPTRTLRSSLRHRRHRGDHRVGRADRLLRPPEPRFRPDRGRGAAAMRAFGLNPPDYALDANALLLGTRNRNALIDTGWGLFAPGAGRPAAPRRGHRTHRRRPRRSVSHPTRSTRAACAMQRANSSTPARVSSYRRPIARGGATIPTSGAMAAGEGVRRRRAIGPNLGRSAGGGPSGDTPPPYLDSDQPTTVRPPIPRLRIVRIEDRRRGDPVLVRRRQTAILAHGELGQLARHPGLEEGAEAPVPSVQRGNRADRSRNEVGDVRGRRRPSPSCPR